MDWIGSIVGIFGLVMTALALWLASRQMSMARDQTRDLAEVGTDLGVVIDSLSTRFAGYFPMFSRDIAALIRRAEKRVDIFCDLPAYGLITNQSGWFEIEEAIRNRLNAGKTVSAVLYGPARRKRILEEQRGHQSFLERGEDEIRAIQRVLETQGDDRPVESLTEDDVITACLARHKAVISETFRDASVQEVRHHIPIYCWIIDEREAVFSVPVFAGDSTEYGFSTRDGKLVNALLKMKGRYPEQVS